MVGLSPRPGAAISSHTLNLIDGVAQPGPAAVALARRRRDTLLLALDNITNQAYSYCVGPSLNLTLVGVTSTGLGPRSIATVCGGNFAITANSGSHDLSVLQIGRGGALTEIGRTRSGGDTPFAVAAPFDDLALVVNRDSNTLNGFGVNTNGRLWSLGRPIHVGLQPHQIAVSERGLVAVANNQSDDLSLLGFDSRRNLLPIDEAFSVGASPKALAWGNFGLELHVGTRPGGGLQDRIQKYAPDFGGTEFKPVRSFDAGYFLTGLATTHDTLFAVTVNQYNRNEIRAYDSIGCSLAASVTTPGPPSFQQIVASDDCGPTGQAVFLSQFQAGKVRSASYTFVA